MNNTNVETLFQQALAADIEESEMSVEEFDLVNGGYACDYLGVHDYRLMMSYYSRQYCC